MNMKNRMKGWLSIAILTVLPGMLFAETQITHLRVQDSVEPLAIEDMPGKWKYGMHKATAIKRAAVLKRV